MLWFLQVRLGEITIYAKEGRDQRQSINRYGYKPKVKRTK
jgi:hypothetical protein